MKTQVVVSKADNQIICTDFCEGKKHDFRLFKDSGVHCLEETELLADSGYLGINTIHPNSQIPKKSSKKKRYQKPTNKTIKHSLLKELLWKTLLVRLKDIASLASVIVIAENGLPSDSTSFRLSTISNYELCKKSIILTIVAH